MLSTIVAWLRQPTTIAGISGIAYGIMELLLGKVTAQSELPLLVGSLVAIIIPDNSALQTAAVQIATDAMSAASSTLLNTAATVAKKSAAVLLVFGIGCSLAGCAGSTATTGSTSSTSTPATSWANTVAVMQLTWPIAEAGINADLGTVTPAVTQAEATVTAAIAALSGTTAPTSLAPALADVQAVIAALPTSAISPTHQQQIQALLAVVQAGVAVFG